MSMSRIFACVAFLGFIGPLIHASSECVGPKELTARIAAHPDAEVYVELGTWFGHQEQYACAAQAYENGLKMQPESSLIYYLLGLNFLRSGNTQAAIEPLQRSIQLQPHLLKPHLLLANAYEQLREAQQAKTEWEAALKIDPHSVIGLDGLCRNLLAEGDAVSVIHLLGTSPREEPLIVDLSDAYQKEGMAEQAIELLTKAANSNPASLQINSALITTLATQARYAEGIKLAAKLVATHPSDVAAKKIYLHMLVLNDDYASARPLAKRLLSAQPHDFEVLYFNGVVERAAGEYTAAREHLREAVDLNPNSYNCHYTLAFVLEQLKDLNGARDEFERAIALGATEPEVHFQLAGVLRELGNSQEAAKQLRLYQQAQREKANKALATVKVAQADKEFNSGDIQKAIGLYREAASATPEDAMIQYKLAVALERVSDIPGEQAALERAVQIDPSMAIAHYQLGYLAGRAGDTERAEVQFRAAVRAAPAYVDAWIKLAATLGAESRFEEAKKMVERGLQLDPKNPEALQLQKDLTTASSAAQ